jgi:hypothetical protein
VPLVGFLDPLDDPSWAGHRRLPTVRVPGSSLSGHVSIFGMSLRVTSCGSRLEMPTDPLLPLSVRSVPPKSRSREVITVGRVGAEAAQSFRPSGLAAAVAAVAFGGRGGPPVGPRVLAARCDRRSPGLPGGCSWIDLTEVSGPADDEQAPGRGGRRHGGHLPVALSEGVERHRKRLSAARADLGLCLAAPAVVVRGVAADGAPPVPCLDPGRAAPGGGTAAGPPAAQAISTHDIASRCHGTPHREWPGSPQASYQPQRPRNGGGSHDGDVDVQAGLEPAARP